MGLISCQDCGKQISDRAAVCIGCGAPLVENTPSFIDLANAPDRASYDKVNNRFHGTTLQIMNLAIEAIQQLKWKVNSANEAVGLVTFQTGVTWGSWSGVVGSLHIRPIANNYFEVSGSGKQNLSGGQILALNIGNEAQRKVDKVIAAMAEIAPTFSDDN